MGICWLVVAAAWVISLAAVGTGVYLKHHSQLRHLLSDVHCRRKGQAPQPIMVPGEGDLGQLAREYNDLFAAFIQARQETAHILKQTRDQLNQRTGVFKLALKKIEKNAQTDPLSGLANRRNFEQSLQLMFLQALKTDTDLACVMLDLDNFKTINDKYGHATGDELIKFVGRLLRSCTRQNDLSARYGGDEFVILLHDANLEKALTIAQRIRQFFAREGLRFIPPSTGSPVPLIQPHLSMGIATIRQSTPAMALDLLRMADEALYKAKHAGRDRIVVA